MILPGNISKFDYIFLDLNMPELDGFQTIQRLRDLQRGGLLKLSNTPVIALSANTQSQFLNMGCYYLFDDFLEKPV